jgi:putative phosphoesterase
MKYAVFSDIHGNACALRHMLNAAELENIDGYICCGDIAGYYYDIEETVKLLKGLNNLYFVKGNHDIIYQTIAENPTIKEQYAVRYGNSYLNDVSPIAIDFLQSQPTNINMTIQGHHIGVFHGAPDNPTEGRIYPDCSQFDETLRQYDICFLGHTHYRMVKRVNNTLLVNPGSIGQPRDGAGFSYCIFDFSDLTCKFNTVNFDKEELRDRIKLTETIEKNRNYLLNVLDRGERIG